MPGTSACVTTANASRYMQQMCKHFGHKVPVEFDTISASVDFPFGDCRMKASEGELDIVCTSDTDETLERTKQVIYDHLVRFAWREKPVIVWCDRD